MTVIATTLLATLAIAAAAPSVTPPPPPINLVIREEGEMLRVSVVGLATAAYSARYTLEVDGQGPAGRNRTTQSGATTLAPGERKTLLATALGVGGAGHWHAALIVTPAEGAPYRQERGSQPAQ